MLSLSYPKFGTTYPGTETRKAPRILVKTPKPESNPYPVGAKITLALRSLLPTSIFLFLHHDTDIIHIAAFSTSIFNQVNLKLTTIHYNTEKPNY